MFGELEGSVIHFIYKNHQQKFRISSRHMDITAREFLTKGVEKKIQRKLKAGKKQNKANNPEASI